jgi:hypothetical protein
VADDLVTHLRQQAAECHSSPCDCQCPNLLAAADEIERSRKEVDLKGYRLDDALDEIERLRAENEVLASARLHLRRLLDNFLNLCTEEQHNVEMLLLHRAAMKQDPWERSRAKGARRG